MRDRLADAATADAVVRLRGARNEAEVRLAAEQALTWLLAFDGLFMAGTKRKKKRAR